MAYNIGLISSTLLTVKISHFVHYISVSKNSKNSVTITGNELAENRKRLENELLSLKTVNLS